MTKSFHPYRTYLIVGHIPVLKTVGSKDYSRPKSEVGFGYKRKFSVAKWPDSYPELENRLSCHQNHVVFLPAGSPAVAWPIPPLAPVIKVQLISPLLFISKGEMSCLQSKCPVRVINADQLADQLNDALNSKGDSLVLLLKSLLKLWLCSKPNS